MGASEGGGTTNKWTFALGAGPTGGELNFHVNGPSVGGHSLAISTWNPSPGQWYELAVTREGDLFTVFVDGVELGSQTRAIAIPNPQASLTIGQAEGLGFFPGQIDELRIVRTT